MSLHKSLIMAAVFAAGAVSLASTAQAQYYYEQSPYGRRAAPQQEYVGPKIRRKQAEMRQRVINKYGFDPAGPQYAQPRYRQQQQYYPQQRQQPYYQQQPQYYPPQRGYGNPYGYQRGVPNPQSLESR